MTATVCSKQAATKSEKSTLHTKNAQAARLQQTMSPKVAATKSRKISATKSRKVAATKSRKVAATKSSKTNLHTKNSQAATMPRLAAAAKPHACCLFAAIHCDKPFISIRVVLEKKIFKGLYHIRAWRPSCSCDLDHLYKLSFSLPKEAPHEIWH